MRALLGPLISAVLTLAKLFKPDAATIDARTRRKIAKAAIKAEKRLARDARKRLKADPKRPAGKKIGTEVAQ